MLRTCTAPLTRYASIDGRPGNEHGSLTLLLTGKSSDRERSDRASGSKTCA